MALESPDWNPVTLYELESGRVGNWNPVTLVLTKIGIRLRWFLKREGKLYKLESGYVGF